ncbi:pantothenate kinase [Candidatus Borreliella tachyglossi]|uniref:Type III pantothenate kinase n=1 Tax=Candidatus Borreliella tachyglossi TaxID=1964448 RepID=A0A2S1LX88_9SPIR|nr:type III pantothenate kinase [Candidatus Borreliella tachyglossi]AWG42896.1 pantothenate kinase [Candidatus Borreliella tachyglossi]
MNSVDKFQLIIDVGNTSISFASYRLDQIQIFCKLETRHDLNFKEIYEFLKLKFDLRVDKVFISSVVPVIDKVLTNVIVFLYEVDPLFIRFDLDYSLSFNPYKNSRFLLGSDVFANLIGAIEIYNLENALVADLGTACTVFAISRSEGIFGGLINSGPLTNFNALIASAYLLKDFNLAVPKELLGVSTISSVNSGVIYQYKYLIEGVYYELTRNYNKKFNLIITGGNSYLVLPLISVDFIFNMYLTIEGIKILGNSFKRDNF